MKENKKDLVYEDLKSRILQLDLVPGAALDEAVLASQYDLSRTPLREVLQRLGGEGYAKLESHRGASVSSMDLNTMRNFFQSAPMIYAAIARLSVEHSTGEQLEILKTIQRRFQRAVNQRSVSEMTIHNHNFHEQMGVMAASPYLFPSLCRLLIDHTRMSHRFYGAELSRSDKHIKDACDQHDRMIDAIENGEPGKIVEVTLAHWELSRKDIDQYVLPDALPLGREEVMELSS